MKLQVTKKPMAVYLVFACLTACNTYSGNSGKDTSCFQIVSVDSIGTLHAQAIRYDTLVVDHHFPESAVYFVPNHRLTLKFDTLSKYAVEMTGALFLRKKDAGGYDCTHIDSVGIYRINIRKDRKTVFYTNKKTQAAQILSIGKLWRL